MRKKISLLFITLLILQTISNGYISALQINAEEREPNVFTNITITNNGEESSTVDIHVEWSLKGVDIEVGKNYAFPIPKEITILQEQTGLLFAGENEIGKYQSSTDGLISASFNEIVEEYPEASGSFVIQAEQVIPEVSEEKTDQNEMLEEKSQQDNAVEQQEKATDDRKTEEQQINSDEKEQVPVSKEEAAEDKEKDTSEEAKTDENVRTKDKNADPASDLGQVTTNEKKGFVLELNEVTDLNNDKFSEENLLNPKDEFKLKLGWHLENGHTYKSGDIETFTLSKGIKILDTITGELADPSGDVVATYKITTDNKVELTFTDFVESNSNVRGWLEVISSLDEENVEVEDGEAIIHPIGEEGEIRIPIDQGNKEKTIEKKGTPNKGYNADEIHWEVIINKNKTSLTNAKITDMLPEGTEYKEGSLKVIKLKTDLYGNILGDAEEVEVTGETVENGALTIPLGNIKDAYRIEYMTTVTDNDKKEFKNEATLSDDELEDVTANSTVTINRGEAIKKKAAKSYDPKTGIIEWEIEFNYNQKSLADVILKDEWTPKGKMELVEESLLFQEVTIDEDGQAHHKGEAVKIPEGAELVKGEDQFEIEGITTDKAYKITYQTKVKDRVLDAFEIANTAGFGTESGSSGTGVGTYYGSKSAGTIDYKNKTIDWKIEINHDEYPMKNISITDTLGAGLTLKEGSINITIDGQKYEGDYTLSGDNPFTIKFPENFTTNKKIVITYKTDFVADEVPNHRPTNKASITWTPEGSDNPITKDIEAGTELNENTQNNHWKNGSYNPATKEITWTIYTNYRENQIDNLIVQDAPQGDQKIVPDSVVVTELAIDENGNITDGQTLSSSVANIDENANTLQVNIGNTSKAHKIVYKTSLAGLSNIQKEYVNKAEVLDGRNSLSEIDAKVGIYGDHKYGNKSGYQDGKQVHWSIQVNLAQQKVENLKLVDTISDNQAYLENSITVYYANFDQNGNVTKGEVVPADEYDLEIDSENQFTIEWNEAVERAFIVEYSTLFFEQHGKNVGNQYKITGDSIEANDDSAENSYNVQIRQLSSGGGSGEAGYLVIDKVDVTYGRDELKLEGAVFDLIDPDTGKVLKTGKTDENGHIDFGRLLFGKYELHERVVPNGYVTPKERQTIEIKEKYEPGNDKTKTTYRVENYEPVFAVELTKTDDVDSSVLLEGAEFALFDSDGERLQTDVTNEDGKILFENLKQAGTYYVQETKAPKYYKLDETKHEVIIGDKEPVPVKLSVDNSLIPGKGKLQKVDADNPNTGLENAVFEVFNEEGSKVDTITTNASGVATTKELPPGKYTVQEKTPPKGFKESATIYELMIPKADDVLEYNIGEDEGIIKNEVKTTNIVLTKNDSINEKQFLAGAEFELKYVDGDYSHPTTTETTGPDGKVTFENLKPGTYQIIETKAPEGYIHIQDSEPMIVEVTLDDVQNGTEIARNIRNAPLAEVIVEKKDSETNVVLEGAEFKVTNADGDVLTGLKTNANGQISITGLLPGKYELVETKAPKGYKLDSTPQSFEVIEGVDETVRITKTFLNEIIKGSVELVKVDGDNDVPLEGVEFTLKANSLINGGTYTETTHTTNANGEISVDNLRPGSYVFTETGTLDKYQTHWKDIEFTINLQNEKHEVKLGEIVNYKLVDIDVTKNWNDNNDDAELRPEKVEIELYRQVENGQKENVKTVEISGTGKQWKYTFTGLDAVDSNGKKYEYTVKEKQAEGYQQESQAGNQEVGFVITNVLTTSMDVLKEWKDEKESDRPDNITVELYRTVDNKEELVETIAIDSTDEWQHTFTNLPVYDKAGNAYEYNVKEIDIDKKYKLEGIVRNGNSFTITNVRTGETEIEVEKAWLDEGEASRPEEGIVVELYRSDNTEKPLETETIKADSEWKHIFDNLAAFDEDGKAYTYTVQEQQVAGYTLKDIEKTDKGYTITNVRTGETEVTVEKEWKDNNNETGDRPGEITVELYQNGSHLKDLDATIAADEGNWKYTFKNLAEFDSEGKAYTYNVKEKDVKGYTSNIQSTENGYKITNVRTDTTEVAGVKTWVEVAEQYRPDSITVNLLANGEPTGKSIEVTEKDEWKYVFTDLDQFDEEGRKIKYTVKEDKVVGYQSEVNDYNITNSQETIEISGTKMWKDNGEGRPESITVQVMNGETVIKEQEVIADANGEWEYTFTDLAKYDSDGNKIEYTINELPVPGYKTEIVGFDIINTKTDKLDVEGTKTWKDDESEDRPTEIIVQLLANGNEVDRATVTAETKWTYKFTNLDAYDDNGIAIKYTVAELPIDGYETIINGYDITNVRTGTTKITGEKTWVEVDKQYRPESITVNLLANGSKIDKVEVSAKTNWEYSFIELAQFDSEGKEIEYTVEEEKLIGYKSKTNGYNIINTQETTEISGEKTWKDNNNATEDRPKSITVQIMNGKTVVKEQEVIADDNGDWNYTFTDLAKYDLDGNEIEYTINELPVPGYQTRIDGYNIINTRADVKSIEISKTWLDHDSADRPDSIEVELFRSIVDGEKELVDSYTLTEDAGWSLEVKDLPAFNEDGKAYTYEVKEKAVPGYETTINGFEITNLRVGETSVEGTKTWLDDDSNDRPESIIVHLLANGEKTGKTVEVTAESEWKYAFTNLEKYDEQGKEIAYTVDEEAVEGYEKSIDGYDITNLRVGKTEVEVIKLWEDENETDRPDTITVNLLQNGVFYKEYEVTKENDWKLTITDLPKYDETGKAYEYTVKEHDVPGYVSEVDGFEITNTRTDIKSIEISKTWLDHESADRPDSIEVELFRSIADGEKELVDSYTLTGDAGWSLEVKDLPAFNEDGKAYTYEVKEKAVPGYETMINGFEITNLRVGETSVEGTKTWLDDDSNDRPESIVVHLLANGEETGKTVEVTAESEWKYAFTNLEKYDEQGKEIAYTVDEEAVDGYEKSIAGYDITNLRVGKTEVEVIKLWKDENETDRPDTITVNLLQNGVFYKEYEVTKENDWKLTITDLPKYDETGKAYEYTVKEHDVPGYVSKVDGFEITNTRTDIKTIEISKVWLDHDSADRPDSIEVELFRSIAGGEKELVDSYTLTEDAGWSLEVKDLPAFNEDGKAYTYEVKEKAVPGYETTINGFEITNLRVGKTSVEGTKTWLDDDSNDRPEVIKVNLLQNGEVIHTQEVTAETDWKYSFKDLEKYDENGAAYEYTVKEEAVEGYESLVEGYDITNLRVGKTTVEGTKTWKDGDSQDRPEVIEVHLLQNGAVFKTQEVTAATDWQYRFAGLDQYDENGVAYKYTVKEEPIKGYESTVAGYDITNLRVGKTTVEGTKTWKDDNSQNRPEVIKVHLLQNGEVIETEEVTAATDWKYSFKDLEKYDENGVAYNYAVKEEPIKGYESTVDGYDITNVRVGKTSIEGTKTWKDDHANDRPKSIKVNLLQNGVVIDTVEVTSQDDWKYSFKDLEKYDENGMEYHYIVKEQGVPGYKSEVHGFDITNIRSDKTSVDVTKGWLDDNAEDRPASIQVHLLQNGEVIQTVVVKAENDWKHEFTDLDAFDENGRAYHYTVEEEPIAGYKTTVDGYDITNVRIGTTEVTGSKTWKDDNSADRPASITVNLLQNGRVVDSAEVTADSNWKYSFSNLEKYDENGVEYKYAVREKEVVGYETTIDGFDITNVRVGQTEVAGSKTWEDDEPQDRPDFIIVELLQNGNVIATKEVTASDDWTYHFINLDEFDENGKEYIYTINEQAVTGYETTIDGYDITNKLIYGSVELTKYNENGEVLEGAVFELQDQAGNVLQTGLTTDQAGKLIVSNLKPGDYQFVEVKAPSGYELDQAPIVFTIEKGQTEVTKIKAVNYKTLESPKPERPEPNIPEPNKPDPNKPGSTIDNDKDPSTTPKDPNHELPNTATNYYNKMLLGVGLLIIGLSLFLFYRRRRTE